MDVVWKGVLGGVITGLIVWLAKRGNTLPGILPLFPTFGVIALLVVGAKGSPAGFREACLASAKTIPAYLAFLAGCYLAIGTLDFRLAVLAGLGLWFVVALAVFWGPRLL